MAIGAWCDREPTTFCKRVIDLKDYEDINMLSLVRTAKIVPVLQPTPYT